jgi:CheY-like chemotaxis protein
MPLSTLGPSFASQRVSDTVAAGNDVRRVLVVGTSSVNCVVVARILERSGLGAVAKSPEEAVEALLDLRPGIVVLDGGANNSDCDDVLARIAEWRTEFGKAFPRVVFLSMRGVSPQNEALAHAVDAVVAKPFTPESLQPVVDRLLRQATD